MTERAAPSYRVTEIHPDVTAPDGHVIQGEIFIRSLTEDEMMSYRPSAPDARVRVMRLFENKEATNA